MLFASSEVGRSLLANIDELSANRGNWNADYANHFIGRVEDALEKHMGVKKDTQQVIATSTVNKLHKESNENLSFLKQQIEVDFGTKESKKVLKRLGIPPSITRITNGKHSAMVKTLYSIKKGMTDDLRNDIVARGTRQDIIDQLITAANQLKEAEIMQEMLKTTSKEITSDTVEAFNAIYAEAIGICKIASAIYKNDPLKREMFTFSKIVAKMSISKKKDKETSKE